MVFVLVRLSYILMERFKERMRRFNGEGLISYRKVEKDVVFGLILVLFGNIGRGGFGFWIGSFFIYRVNLFYLIFSYLFIY